MNVNIMFIETVFDFIFSIYRYIFSIPFGGLRLLLIDTVQAYTEGFIVRLLKRTT